MSRNKLLPLALALLIACAPVEALAQEIPVSDDLLMQTDHVTEAANYETVVVSPGVFERVYSTSCTPFYPYTCDLRFETPDARFKEYFVRRNQEVKAGDVLATFTLESDEIALTTQRLALRQAREDLATQQEADEEAIRELKASLGTATDPFERRRIELEIERRETAGERYVYQQQRRIAGLEEEIAELEEAGANRTLVAPVDGVITDVAYMHEGDRVSPDAVLVSLYREDGMLMRVEDSAGNFRYGMKVQVVVGPAKKRTTLTGTVVGADTLVPEALRSHYAYIRLDPYDPSLKLQNPIARVQVEYVENVIVVPRDAVKFEGGKYYVTKLVDGTLQKRYVQQLTTNATVAWLAEGVEPGDTLVIE